MIMAFRFKLTFLFVVGWAAAAFGQRAITLNPVQVAGTIVQVAPGQNRGQGRQRTELDPEPSAARPKSRSPVPPNRKC